MMGAVNDIREANRASPLFTHLTTVSEGIAMLGWITIDPKPADYVSEVLGSAQFYGNRVIKEYKERSVAIGVTFARNVLIPKPETGNTSNGPILSTAFSSHSSRT